MKVNHWRWAAWAAVLCLSVRAGAQADIKAFEANAARAKELGATHVVVTDELPLSFWQLDPPDDPYPAWFMYHPGIMKIFPPAAVAPFMNAEYSAKVQKVLAERCAVLRRLGLKAAWNANEPQVLPEGFFKEHPELRGPRVDHPNRSKTARFAPCVDKPEVLALYRESMQSLLKALPEVEIFSFLTSDSGSGFCWTPALYAGLNGPAWCKDHPMEERVAGLMNALQGAAKAAGHAIRVNINPIAPRQWMPNTFESNAAIARALGPGLSIANLEGPDARRSGVRRIGSARAAFHPVLGLPVAVAMLRGLQGWDPQGTDPVVFAFGDSAANGMQFRIVEAYRKSPAKTELQRLTLLRKVAADMAGEDRADALLDLWLALDDVDKHLDGLDFGSILTMGSILGRWINRPFVPFPEELEAAEKEFRRPFLFQAKGEAEALNMADIQAMDMYEGWGARLLVQRSIELAQGKLASAEATARRLAEGAPASDGADPWPVLAARLETLQRFLRNIDNTVKFQAQLTRVKHAGEEPEIVPPLGAGSDWERDDLLAIARDEIDNAAALRKLLIETKVALVDATATPEEENIRRLGPGLADQLKRKIDVMNAHWMDYNRLFASPQP